MFELTKAIVGRYASMRSHTCVLWCRCVDTNICISVMVGWYASMSANMHALAHLCTVVACVDMNIRISAPDTEGSKLKANRALELQGQAFYGSALEQP